MTFATVLSAAGPMVLSALVKLLIAWLQAQADARAREDKGRSEVIVAAQAESAAAERRANEVISNAPDTDAFIAGLRAGTVKF